MKGRRHWREPVLAVAGLALAFAGAGVSLAIAERVQREDGLTIYSLDDPAPAVQPSTPTPEPTPIPDTPTPEPTAAEATATPRPATATSTATSPPATATRTATQAPATATRTPTPRPATATRTPTPRPPTATRTPTPRPPTATRTPTPRPPTATRTPTPRPATATPTPRPATATPTPAGLVLQQTSFTLPADATANNGGTIGPFCCQGRTVTLRSSAGEIVGYVYWYKWIGQAYNFPRGGGVEGALPDVLILVNDAQTGDSSVSFSAVEAASGASRTIDHGRFRFSVTFTSGELTQYQGLNYVWETSLAGTLTVQVR